MCFSFLNFFPLFALTFSSLSAFAATPFEEFKGTYEIKKIISDKRRISQSDVVTIDSEDDDASILVRDRASAAVRYQMALREWRIEGEGRYSVAEFESKDGKASWRWVSNYSRRSVEISPLEGDLFFITLTNPSEQWFVKESYSLVVKRIR
ncbi:MAG: hypothetical protein AB7F66_01895 [Bacteriovoracia bacterium]